MKELVRPAVSLFIVLSLITGVIYPAVVTVLANTVFPAQATGSLIKRGDVVVGSRLIGQSFDKPGYFWGRLSGTGPAYNGAASSGTNYGPLNTALTDAAQGRIDSLRTDGDTRPVPVDLLTSSGSGLDPHISPAAAQFQTARVAKARGMDESAVRELVARFTEGRQFGILGEPCVNVLELNMELDRTAGPIQQ